MNGLTIKNKKVLGNTLQRFSSIFILLLLLIVLSIFGDNFFSLSNFSNIFRQSATLGIMAVGETLVMLMAGIDLSVGNIMAISGCFMAVASSQWNLPPGVTIILGLLIGVVLGLFNGVVITKGKIQPFIATLGLMNALRGGSLFITTGLAVSNMPEPMIFVGGGDLFGIPVSIFVWIFVVIIGWVLLSRTRFGRNVMAIGGNLEAAKASGIRTDRVQIVVYAISGLCASLSSLALIGRLNSANALMGGGYELNTITACAIGGISLAGGRGGIMGAFIGAITIGVINNGLDLLNVSPFLRFIILGLLIIAVVILDSYRSRKFKE